MNAEQMELARRFVACERWAPIRGMAGTVTGGPSDMMGTCVTWDGHGWADADGDAIYGHCKVLPDLDDAMTRCAMLEVVRRAWSDETACLRWACRDPFAALWVWEAGEGRDRQTGWAASELHALLAALEAAPHA